MRPGMQVRIPSVGTLQARFPDSVEQTAGTTASPAPAAAPRASEEGQFLVSSQGEPLYRVGAGDTLTSIAQRHLGRASRWEQIAKMNADLLSSPDRLKVGLILRLPHDASHVPLAPEGAAVR